MFQDHALIGRLTAFDNVLLGLADARSPWSLLPWPRAAQIRAAKALDDVGLLARAHRPSRPLLRRRKTTHRHCPRARAPPACAAGRRTFRFARHAARAAARRRLAQPDGARRRHRRSGAAPDSAGPRVRRPHRRPQRRPRRFRRARLSVRRGRRSHGLCMPLEVQTGKATK